MGRRVRSGEVGVERMWGCMGWRGVRWREWRNGVSFKV